MNYKLILIKLAILSLLVLGISAILFSMEQPALGIIPQFSFVVFYFFLLSSFQYYNISRIRTDNVRVFHTKYMAWFGVKLFINLTVVVLYFLLNKESAKSFLIYFIILYAIYMIFDTYHLANLVKKIK